MSAHTPTPWVVETPMGDETPWIVEVDKEVYEWRCIAMACSDDSINDEHRDPITPLTKADAAANAAFIVLTCNAHDKLVEALNAMRGQYMLYVGPDDIIAMATVSMADEALRLAGRL